MQTIESFAEKIKKKPQTIKLWCEKGYIPGAIIEKDQWVLPDHARVPDTDARARRPGKIYYRILKSCDKGMRPIADAFKVDKVIFQSYIDGLLEENLLKAVSDADGNIQYIPTLRGEEKLKEDERKAILALDKIAEAVAAGFAEVAVTKILGG